jgi:carboxypeptidase family protein
MKIQRILFSLPLVAFCFTMASSARGAGVVSGKVTVEDLSSNTESVRTSAQSNAAKPSVSMASTGAAAGQVVAPRNVVVYAVPGAPSKPASNKQPMAIAQDGCHFTEAVLQLGFVPLAPYTGQMVNSVDEEIIPVKCAIGTGARKYFVVLKTPYHSVTGENGTFSLSGLAPGKYTITAWDETYGSQSQEVTITGNETASANFVFRPKSKA